MCSCSRKVMTGCWWRQIISVDDWNHFLISAECSTKTTAACPSSSFVSVCELMWIVVYCCIENNSNWSVGGWWVLLFYAQPTLTFNHHTFLCAYFACFLFSYLTLWHTTAPSSRYYWTHRNGFPQLFTLSEKIYPYSNLNEVIQTTQHNLWLLIKEIALNHKFMNNNKRDILPTNQVYCSTLCISMKYTPVCHALLHLWKDPYQTLHAGRLPQKSARN